MSCIISDKRLYLGGTFGYLVFEKTFFNSAEPLTRVTTSRFKRIIKKILDAGTSLIFVEESGFLFVFDKRTLNITHNH
jgi:hypothetical protein